MTGITGICYRVGLWKVSQAALHSNRLRFSSYYSSIILEKLSNFPDTHFSYLKYGIIVSLFYGSHQSIYADTSTVSIVLLFELQPARPLKVQAFAKPLSCFILQEASLCLGVANTLLSHHPLLYLITVDSPEVATAMHFKLFVISAHAARPPFFNFKKLTFNLMTFEKHKM